MSTNKWKLNEPAPFPTLIMYSNYVHNPTQPWIHCLKSHSIQFILVNIYLTGPVIGSLAKGKVNVCWQPCKKKKKEVFLCIPTTFQHTFLALFGWLSPLAHLYHFLFIWKNNVILNAASWFNINNIIITHFKVVWNIYIWTSVQILLER